MREVAKRSASGGTPAAVVASEAACPGSRRRGALRCAGALGVWTVLGGLTACAAPSPPLKVGTVLHPACELLFLAREMGLLGVRDIRLVELLSRADNLRLLEEGALHASVLSLDEFVRCRAARQDLRIVCVLGVSEGADAVMARVGLTEPGHLRGKRIAVEDASTGMVLLEALLAAASLRADDVVRVPVRPGQGLPQFRAAAVDAVVTTEPFVSQLEARGAERVFDSARLPHRLASVLAVRSHVLDAQSDAVRQLVAAHFAALEQFERDPGRAWPLMAPRLRVHHDQLLEQDASAEQLGRGFRGHRLLPVAAQRDLLRAGGGVDLAQRALQQDFVARRQLERVLPLQDLLDTRFLPSP
jgi:NitT/TauT family transport system substrate-binding protein